MIKVYLQYKAFQIRHKIKNLAVAFGKPKTYISVWAMIALFLVFSDYFGILRFTKATLVIITVFSLSFSIGLMFLVDYAKGEHVHWYRMKYKEKAKENAEKN